MKNPIRFSLAVLAVVFALTLSARGQITFTVSATADNTAGTIEQNYTPGRTYTFVYTLTAAYPANKYYFPGRNTDWFEKDTASAVPLFTAVGGSGLGGTFTDPTGPQGSPFSFVRASGSNFLGLLAGADSGHIGVTTLPGTSLTHVIASMNLAEVDFAAPSAYTNPATYFSAYLGDHRAWGGTVGLYGGGFDGATFQVTNVNIGNVSAIPEPATYAALLGLGALGVAAWRRRGGPRRNAVTDAPFHRHGQNVTVVVR
jgi:hypothetical protein